MLGGGAGAGPFLMLDSAGSALMRVDPITGTSERIYQASHNVWGGTPLRYMAASGVSASVQAWIELAVD